MIDLTEPTNETYDIFGQPATHYAGSTDSGTECTVLFTRKGQEQTDYGVSEAASIRVRRSEITDPRRGHRFDVDGRSWRVEFILGADEGTNELETALACIDTTHLGMSP